LSFGTGGGSFGGGGSGTIRYAIIIDDSQVNSKLSNIEQRLNQLNSATQSVGTGLTSLNNGMQTVGTSSQTAATGLTNLTSDVQTLGSTTQTTKTDLDAINSNWTTMEQGAKNSANSVDALGNSFKSTKGGLNQYNTLSETVVTNTNNMADANVTAGQKLRTFGGFLKDNALAVGAVASSAIQLVQGYTQMQRAQLNAERASLLSEKANQRMIKAQDALNKAIEKFGPTSHEAAVKAEDLRLAQEAAGLATQKAGLMAQTAQQQTMSFFTNLIPQSVLFVSGIVQMASGLKDLGPQIKTVAGNMKGLSLAMVGLAAPALVVVAGIYAIIGALTAAQKLNELVQKKTGGAAKQMSILENMRKALFGTPQEKKEAADFNKQLENNVVTADEYKTILEESFDPSKMLDNITNKVNESLGKLNTTQVDTTTITEDTTAKMEELDTAFKSGRMTFDEYMQHYTELGQEQNRLQDSNKGVTQSILDIDAAAVATGKRIDEQLKPAVTTMSTESEDLRNSFILGSDALEDYSTNVTDLTTEVDHATPLLDKLREAGDKAKQTFEDFAESAKQKLNLEFGIKDPEKQADKLIDKFVDHLDKKAKKKIIKIRKIEAEDNAIKNAAGQIIAGLKDIIVNDDTLADSVAKQLIKDQPDTAAGDRMKKFLKEAIDRSDTGQYLVDNLDQTFPGNYVLTIPVEGHWTGFDDSSPAGFGGMDVGANGNKNPNKRTSTSAQDIDRMLNDADKNYTDLNEFNMMPGWNYGHLFNKTDEPAKPWYLDPKDTQKPYAYGSDQEKELEQKAGYFYGVNDVPAAPEGGANDKFMQLLIGMGGGGKFGGFGGGAGFGFAAGSGKMGVGQKILDAAGSGQFAQIAVGAQEAQKALANLAVQGGKSMQILANLILKNTANLMGNFVTIAKQSQLAQTALANLAVQGGKSFQILANLILANTSNLLGNFTTINTNAQKSQTALANLANQGSNSFSILQSSAAQHTKSLNTYMGKTIPVAAQKSQKALANLSNEGSNSMSLLAKNSGKHTKSMNTYLGKTIPVAAQKSQTSLANLSNEGSKSMKALADATEKAASRIKSALNSIPSGGGGGGFSGFDGGGFNFASGGDFITSGPQMIMVGESGRERVTVTPLGANASSGNGIGGATVNQTISLNISGSDLINQRNLTKRIKLTVGEQRDKFG